MSTVNPPDQRHLISFDLHQIDQLAQQFDERVVNQALNRSLNRMQSKLRTQIAKNVRAYYNVPAARVKQALSIRRVTVGSSAVPSRVLVYAGTRVGLTQFGGTTRTVNLQATSSRGKRFSTRRQAAYMRIKRQGQRQRAQHRDGMLAFPAMGQNNNPHFFTRKRGAKKTIRTALYGPSVPHMVNPYVRQQAYTLLEEELPKAFNHNMDYYLGKQVGLY